MSWASEIEANNLDQTYIKDFLDVKGNIINRTGYLTVLDGDVSFNTGNLYVGGDVDIIGNITGNYPDNSIPAAAINGQVEATPNFNGDVQMNGNLDICGNFLNTQAISLGGHVIPTSNAAYDLGNAEYKIRHLFLSDNSLWVGDQHKIDSNGGKMKFKKRDVNKVPATIAAAGGNDSNTGKPIAQMTLHDWLTYARTLGSVNGKDGDAITIQDIFTDDADFEFSQDANVSSQDMDLGSNKILYSNVYSTTSELPDASIYHGMFAHVHADGGAYFSHSGSWHQLANIQSPNFTGAIRMNGITVGTGNSSSTDNTVVGFESGKILSTGLRNTSVGTSTLSGVTGGNDNTAIGYGAGSACTGNENTFMGSYSGVYNVAGSNNTSLGYLSLLCNVAGTNNVAIGHNAIFGAQNNDSTNNTAVGSSSLKAVEVGGNNNTAIGVNSGAANKTGANNTYLGQGADANSNSFSNSTAVGSESKITKSDQIVLGKSTSPPEVYIPGRVGVGNNNPMTIMQIGPDLATDYGYNYDENALLVTHPTPISDTAVNDPMTVLYLARDGIPSTSNSVRAAFKLSKYEYIGAQNPKSRLDIGLLENYNDNEPSVLTLLGNGEVQIPGSLVVQGTATAPTVSGTADSTDNIATTAFVQAVVATVDAGSMATDIANKANKENAALTGTPTAPTAGSTTDTTQIATTAFVQERITTIIGGAPAALDTLKEITDALTGADSTAGAITTTIADNATAITTEKTRAESAEGVLQTNIDNLNSSVSSGSTFVNATDFAHYSKPIHIGGDTEPASASLEVTGNIKASGDVIFAGGLKQDDGAGNLTDFQGGAFSIEAGGFAHYSDNIHIGGSTAPSDGSKLEVTGDIKMSGVIRQW